MARSHLRSKGLDMFQVQIEPEATPQTLPMFDLNGMNTVSPLTRMMGTGVSRLVQNLVIREGAYQVRDGTSVLGDISPAPIIGVYDMLTSENIAYLIRFRSNGVDTFSSGVWSQAGGDSFNGYTTTPLAITPWNETVLFTAGMRGIFELTLGRPGTVHLIDDTPISVQHMTVFNNRVIASVRGKKIQWSARGDSRDWTGLGSGYEDLLAVPGTQTAVVPITDEQAFVIRSNSVWMMTPTGNFDAPFNFNQFVDKIGSRYAGTVVAIPRGAMFLGNRSVWMVTLDGFENVGQPIRDILTQDQATLRLAHASFDDKWREYRLIIGGRVLRYNLDNKAWTEDTYLFPIRSMHFAYFSSNLTVDELVGTVNALEGAVDDLGVGERQGAFVYAMGGDGRHVVWDDPTRNNEALRDVNNAGVAAEGGFRIESANIPAASPLHRTGLVRVQVEYEADAPFELVFEYSYDGGVTWVLYSTQTVAASDKPAIVSVERWLERENLQIAVSSEASPHVRLMGVHLDVVKGGKIQDAR